MSYNYTPKPYSYRSPWFNLDSEEAYKANLRTHYKELEELGYIDSDIEYCLNSEGLRSEEFQSEPSIIFLGCSFTFGLGLRQSDTWPWIVSEAMGLRMNNLAVCGGSNDTAFRMFETHAWALNPKITILLSPDRARTELILENSVKMYTANQIDDLDSNLWWKEWLSNERNHYLNYRKNILALRLLCQRRNSGFWVYSCDQLLPTIDRARDLKHPGRRSNRQFAERVITDLQGGANGNDS